MTEHSNTMTELTQKDIEDIATFCIKYYNYSEDDRQYIEKIIIAHSTYKTIIVVRNEKNNRIVAVARWNILPTGFDAHILDVIIQPRHRHKHLLSAMIYKGLRMYPQVKYIIFQRHEKNKPFKKIPIHWLINRRF